MPYRPYGPSARIPSISIQNRRRKNLLTQLFQDPEIERRRLEYNETILTRFPGPHTLEPGQTTLIPAMNGGVAIRPLRPGPKPTIKPLPQLPIERRMVGGPQEAQAIALFDAFRREEAGEDEDEEKRTRRSYPRESKIQAIEYAKFTWWKHPNGTLEPLSRYRAALNLGITPKLLKDWVRGEASIRCQRKGSRRAPFVRNSRLGALERRLKDELNDTRATGKQVTAKWIVRHARALYRELFPQCCLKDVNNPQNWIYLQMRFSQGWLQGFCRRHRITLRVQTKRAQKSPEQLRPTVQKWLQFNRRNTVDLPGSDCGKERAPEVEATRVGRFLPCHICNMDQTPMAYEFSSTGRTYNTKGEKTIFLRTGRSGDDKRKLTVQLTIFACGHRHADPLLIFKGAEGLGQRRRKEEMKKYHPGVKVMWNPKGYCNSRVMLKWFKEQYRHASPYSPDDREPRLLVLDAFAPHKNRGSKRKQSQSETAIAKSRAEEQIQQQIREEQAKLNVTLSIIPGGGTGYLQPLDIFFNRLLKALIREQEERWIENNLAKWEACNFTEGERRILITEWVGTAYDTLYEKYKDLIIQTFRNVGLSLNPDGSEDSELKIRDLPDIEVGDWTRQDEDIIEVDSDGGKFNIRH
jgi:hypothetical protein